MLSVLLNSGNITKSDMVSALLEKEADCMSNIPKIGYRQNRGKYYITIPEKYSKTGKRYPVYGKSEKEVVEKYREEVALFLNGSVVKKDDGSVMVQEETLGGCVLNYLRHVYYYTIEPTTYCNVLGSINLHFLNTPLAKKEVTEVNREDLQKFFKSKDMLNVNKITLLVVFRTIRSALDEAVGNNLITKNPAIGIKLHKQNPKSLKSKKEVLTLEEAQKVMAYFEWLYTEVLAGRKSLYCNLWFPLFPILLNTGMRVSEALALTDQDVDLEKGHITINKVIVPFYGGDDIIKKEYRDDYSNKYISKAPKTLSSNRVIQTTPIVKLWFQRLRTLRERYGIDDNRLFVTHNGTPLLRGGVYKKWKLVLRDCDVPFCAVHKLRKTFVTLLITSGMQVQDVSPIVGHASNNMTMNVYLECTKSPEAIGGEMARRLSNLTPSALTTFDNT